MDQIESSIENNLKNLSSKFKFYPLALDKCRDVTNTDQIAIFILCVDEASNVTVELTPIYPFKETTKSRDLFEAVELTLNWFALKFWNLSDITTDGAPALVR